MKCAIFLALVAFASATPLTGWGIGYYPERTHWGLWEYQTPHKEVARQVAHQVTEGVLHDQLAYTNQAIQNLHWQLQQYPQGFAHQYPQWTGFPQTPYHYGVQSYGMNRQYPIHHEVPTVQAMHHLQDDMEHQQQYFMGVGPLGHPRDTVIHQLHDTVETGVEAHLVSRDVHDQEVAHEAYIPVPYGIHSEVFQTRLQRLIDEHNEQEIENQIAHHHHWVQQLHQQEQFVQQQRYQIEAQQATVQHQVNPEYMHQLEQVHHQLHLQEYHLIQEQLAHHLVILQLQQALVHKEHQVLQDMVVEGVHEQGTHQPYWYRY